MRFYRALNSWPSVANFAALPDVVLHAGETYIVLAAQGVYFINRKPAGLYRSDGAVWQQLSDITVNYFTDNVATFIDDQDTSRKMVFELAGITSGNTRTLTCPDKSGVMALKDDVDPVSTTITYDGQGRTSIITTSRGTKTFSYNLDGTLGSIVGTGSYKSKSFIYSGSVLTGVTVS